MKYYAPFYTLQRVTGSVDGVSEVLYVLGESRRAVRPDVLVPVPIPLDVMKLHGDDKSKR